MFSLFELLHRIADRGRLYCIFSFALPKVAEHFLARNAGRHRPFDDASESLDDFRYGLFSQMHFMILDETIGIG